MNGIKIGNKQSKCPVIQGGMGVGVSLHRLAGAVSREGGIGVIATADIGFQEPDFLNDPFEADRRAIRKEIQAARNIAGEGILAANVMVAIQNYEETVQECVKSGIDLIISGAGLPLNLPSLVQNSDTKIAPIVSSARAFQLICKSWWKRYRYIPDLVVVEGPEAGGHLGFQYQELKNGKTLDEILLEVLEAVRIVEKEQNISIPVIAAGGIFTGEDVARVLSLGAAGVQVATRFVATKECDASEVFKQAYVDAAEQDIQIIKSPVGLPGRALRNAFLRQIEEDPEPIRFCSRCIKSCHTESAPYCITQALIRSVQGDVDHGLIFCGSNVGRIKQISTVKEVLDDLCGGL